MLGNPPRIALVLLASLAGMLIAGAVARGEPAATAPPTSAADADCLAKPNAPSAPGKHWFYRIDRPSGRHCWYQGAARGGANEATQARPSTRAVAAPANRPAREVPADRPSAARDQADRPITARDQDGDQNAVEPAAAAPTQPYSYSWSTATPAPTPPEQMTPAADDNATPATPAPQVPPPTDTRAEPPLTAPAPSATVRKQVPERPAAVAEDGGHVPPLFGTAFALIIIVLGSVVARLGAKLIRARRRGGVARTASIASPPFLHERDTPGLVPHMPREDDITRATPPPWMMRGAPAARRDAATSGDDATRPIPDSARELEHNVRELLHRMRSDLQAVRRTAAAPAMPRARSAEELDQVPAMWRQGRRRPAG